MNFEQVCELERLYINYTPDVYEKPRIQKRIKSMTIYKGYSNWYYIFLLDYFVCAFRVDGGVGFYTELELRNEFEN